MHFKRHQCQVVYRPFIDPNYVQATQFSLGNLALPQYFPQKMQNSICLLLEVFLRQQQIADSQNLQKSTKFMAYTIFVKCLAAKPCINDLHITILILTSLFLASKFNEVPAKYAVFQSKTYLDWLAPNVPISDLLQFQIQIFCQINFKIYEKSPYQYFDQLISCRSLPQNFGATTLAYIDFALTLTQLLEFNAQEILAGCLAAAQKVRKTENKKINSMVEEFSRTISKTNIVGNIIIQKWQYVLNCNGQESLSN